MWKTGILVLAAATATLARRKDWDPPQFGFGAYKLPGASEFVATPKSGNGTFDQILEHDDNFSKTFSQWYMYSTEYWKGPGSPVILFTPGEANAAPYTSYLTNNRTTGVLAEKIGAAIVVIEHRYWGFSSPTQNLTSDTLQPLTLYNSMQDFVNFAKNAKLPWDQNGHKSNAADVPWVFMGGSYSGALSAWIESTSPGTFWAYHASSAPVEAIDDLWSYFLPIQEHMPQNCSRDVSEVIDYMDNVLQGGNLQQIAQLKKEFGLSNVTHDDDFMSVLENGPWLWQSNQFYTGYSGFYQFCDTIEGVYNNSGATIPDGNGVGLDNALKGYARWIKEIYLPDACANYGYPGLTEPSSTWCFNTYDFNNPLFRDTSLDNQVDRAWNWMLCNEPFGYWQNGAPESRPTLVSRLIDSEYWIRQCAVYFPDGPNGETYGINRGKTENSVNEFTGGWDARNSTRLLYVNGDRDPWRESGVSAETRPGGPLKSTDQTPVFVVPGGFHTSDLVTKNGQVNADVAKVQGQIVNQLVKWVGQWPKKYTRSTEGLHAREWQG